MLKRILNEIQIMWYKIHNFKENRENNQISQQLQTIFNSHSLQIRNAMEYNSVFNNYLIVLTVRKEWQDITLKIYLILYDDFIDK